MISAAPRRITLGCALALAATMPGFAADTHFITGPLESPVFVNSIVGTDLLWENGYYGAGIVIANVEGGHVWSGHEVFDRTAIETSLGITLPPSPAVLVNAPVTVDAPELGEVDFHATMVGHVLVGARTVTNPDSSVSLTLVGAGMAPLATLWSGAIATRFDKTVENAGAFEITEESFRTPYVEFFTGATHGRADVINSSWGDDEATDRSYETRAITGLAAQNPMVSAVFSAGNSGPGVDKVGGPALSFNVIAVGSVGGADQLTPSSFTSGGPVAFYNPATDTTIPASRYAVHVAAPGEDFTLAAYLQPTGGLEPLLTPEITTTDNDYYFIASASGTSFSAPTVAGGVALLKNLVKANPAFLPQPAALDARVIRSVIMASAVRTTGWDNGQAVGPGGALITTQALDALTGAGRFDVGRAAELFVVGTRDVAGLGGGTIDATGWDFGSVALGQHNDYLIDLAGFTTPLEFTVALNWFTDDHFDTVTGVSTYGSFADLNLEVWSVSIGGTYDTLLAASQSPYNTAEFLRFTLAAGGRVGLRVLLAGMVYDFDGPVGADVGYGLAWATTAIPESATLALHFGGACLVVLLVRRRRHG